MKEEEWDVFVFTLDKTSGRFSPTTRYRDYAISRDLIHWESQSTTRADSPPACVTKITFGCWCDAVCAAQGRRSGVLFLGPAEYVKHELEMPMAITWRLKHAAG